MPKAKNPNPAKRIIKFPSERKSRSEGGEAKQAEEIWEQQIADRVRQGKKVAILYSANQSQTDDLISGYADNKVRGLISGGGLAKLFPFITDRIEKAKLHSQVHVMPLATSLTGDNNTVYPKKNYVSLEQMETQLANLAWHLGNGWEIVGIGTGKGFSIGGLTSENWFKTDKIWVTQDASGKYALHTNPPDASPDKNDPLLKSEDPPRIISQGVYMQERLKMLSDEPVASWPAHLLDAFNKGQQNQPLESWPQKLKEVYAKPTETIPNYPKSIKDIKSRWNEFKSELKKQIEEGTPEQVKAIKEIVSISATDDQLRKIAKQNGLSEGQTKKIISLRVLAIQVSVGIQKMEQKLQDKGVDLSLPNELDDLKAMQSERDYLRKFVQGMTAKGTSPRMFQIGASNIHSAKTADSEAVKKQYQDEQNRFDEMRGIKNAAAKKLAKNNYAFKAEDVEHINRLLSRLGESEQEKNPTTQMKADMLKEFKDAMKKQNPNIILRDTDLKAIWDAKQSEHLRKISAMPNLLTPDIPGCIKQWIADGSKVTAKSTMSDLYTLSKHLHDMKNMLGELEKLDKQHLDKLFNVSGDDAKVIREKLQKDVEKLDKQFNKLTEDPKTKASLDGYVKNERQKIVSRAQMEAMLIRLEGDQRAAAIAARDMPNQYLPLREAMKIAKAAVENMKELVKIREPWSTAESVKIVVAMENALQASARVEAAIGFTGITVTPPSPPSTPAVVSAPPPAAAAVVPPVTPVVNPPPAEYKMYLHALVVVAKHAHAAYEQSIKEFGLTHPNTIEANDAFHKALDMSRELQQQWRDHPSEIASLYPKAVQAAYDAHTAAEAVVGKISAVASAPVVPVAPSPVTPTVALRQPQEAVILLHVRTLQFVTRDANVAYTAALRMWGKENPITIKAKEQFVKIQAMRKEMQQKIDSKSPELASTLMQASALALEVQNNSKVTISSLPPPPPIPQRPAPVVPAVKATRPLPPLPLMPATKKAVTPAAPIAITPTVKASPLVAPPTTAGPPPPPPPPPGGKLPKAPVAAPAVAKKDEPVASAPQPSAPAQAFLADILNPEKRKLKAPAPAPVKAKEELTAASNPLATAMLKMQKIEIAAKEKREEEKTKLAADRSPEEKQAAAEREQRESAQREKVKAEARQKEISAAVEKELAAAIRRGDVDPNNSVGVEKFRKTEKEKFKPVSQGMSAEELAYKDPAWEEEEAKTAAESKKTDTSKDLKKPAEEKKPEKPSAPPKVLSKEEILKMKEEREKSGIGLPPIPVKNVAAEPEDDWDKPEKSVTQPAPKKTEAPSVRGWNDLMKGAPTSAPPSQSTPGSSASTKEDEPGSRPKR